MVTYLEYIRIFIQIHYKIRIFLIILLYIYRSMLNFFLRKIHYRFNMIHF